MRKPLLFCLAMIAFLSCQKKPSYTLFGVKLEREKGSKIFTSDPRFLDICHLKNLHEVWLPAIRGGEKVKKTLSSFLPAGYPANEIATVMFYSLHQDTNAWDIALEQTPALSIIRIHDKAYYHDYLERKDRLYEVVPQFSTTIPGGLMSDDIRMLHFASSTSIQLPSNTILYQIRLMPDQLPTVQGEPNMSIGDGLMMDMKRNSGMLTWDLYGEAFYTVMMLDNDGGPGSGHCGNSTTCPSGSTSCIPPPANELDKEFPGQCAAKGGCCNMVMLEARKLSADGKEPFNMKDLFGFRDEFMLKYELGRRYYAYFCMTGRYMKMTPEAMKNYIDVVTVLQQAMVKLKGTDDNAIIFDETFESTFTTFIKNHTGSGVKELESAMSTMAVDLKQNKGLTKAGLIKLFEASNQVK